MQVTGEMAGTGKRLCVIAAEVIVLASVLAGCCDIPGAGEGREMQEIVSQNVSAAGVTALEVRGTNGGCEVRQTTGPEVAILATKRTRDGAEQLGRVSVQVTGGATLTVRTVHPSPPARVSVDYVILVPATIGTISIETSNGGVVVDGVAAQVRAETSDGAIRVTEIGGGASLRTSNGAIEVRGANGVVDAATSDGAITVEDAAGLGNLETSNGRVSAEVRAVFDDVAISTSNAAVDLELAPGLSAEIDAETPAGEISLPAGLLTVEEQAPGRLRATAGPGGHRIRIRTSAAPIRFTATG